MADDGEIARHSLELQAQGRDYRLLDLPGYLEWSKRKLAEGELPGMIAHLDATAAWLLPEEAGKLGKTDYNEMLDELKASLESDD